VVKLFDHENNEKEQNLIIFGQNGQPEVSAHIQL
jgi:hypothetical protein